MPLHNVCKKKKLETAWLSKRCGRSILQCITEMPRRGWGQTARMTQTSLAQIKVHISFLILARRLRNDQHFTLKFHFSFPLYGSLLFFFFIIKTVDFSNSKIGSAETHSRIIFKSSVRRQTTLDRRVRNQPHIKQDKVVAIVPSDPLINLLCLPRDHSL